MKKTLIAASLLALVAAACGSDDDPSSPPTTAPDDPPSLADTTWVASQIFLDGTEYPIVPDSRVTLTFSGANQAGGTTGCNSFGGNVSFDGSSISFGPMSQTEIGCLGPLMDQERVVMQIIANADRWSLADGTLSIGATDGSGGIDFEPPPVVLDAEFASTTWVLDSIVEGQAVRTPVFGVDVTLEIDDVVGTLEGFGGCNGFVGEVVIAAPSMSVENLSHDLAACDPPVTEQEQLFFDVLRSATEFEVEGERLTLVAGDVSLIFRAS